MPQWFDDHLHCSSPHEWLGGLLVGHRARTIGSEPPRALRKLLGGCAPLGADDEAIDVLVHTGELWRPPAIARIDAARLQPGGVLVDLAWVEVWSSAWRLQAWRRGPGQHAAAERISGMFELGLREPQQWVTDQRIALVVTLAVA